MFDVKLTTTTRSTACAPASLKMLLEYYGIEVPLDQLIEECGVSVDGCSAADVLRVGQAHGLEDFKAWQENPEDIFAQDRPGIVWWRYNHFVVFAGLNDKDEPVICNPMRGRYAIDRGSFAAICTGLQTGTAVVLCVGKPENLRKTATANLAAGEFFELGGATCVALRAIARGERLVIGANCETVNLIDLINEQQEEE